MNDVRVNIQERLDTHRRNLADLHQRGAEYGIDAPVTLARQIEHEEGEIERLETLLAGLEKPAGSSVAWSDGDRLRRDLSRWQAAMTNEAFDRTSGLERKLDDIQEVLVAIRTTQALQGQDIQHLKTDTMEISKRLTSLEEAGRVPPEPIISRYIIASGGFMLVLMVILMVLITSRLIF